MFHIRRIQMSVTVHQPLRRQARRWAGRLLPERVRHRLRAWLPGETAVPTGYIRFGHLRRTRPISRAFGFDRGLPIDRYYVEQFLTRQAADIQGRVLEIGDNSYTRRFGGERVTQSDVLHVTDDNPQATFVGDLADAPHIPDNSFDCIVLTQTLHLIYDVQAAVATLYRILRPGGVVLATFPGISQISPYRWGSTWYWHFTTQSAERLFGDVFGSDQVNLWAQGNVLTAVSFLHGMAASELTDAELNDHDPSYEMLITLRACKK